MLTVHSSDFVSLTVDELSPESGGFKHVEDLEDTVNRLVIEKFGTEAEKVPNIYSLRVKKHDLSYTFSYGIFNQYKEPLAFTLDSTKSENMVFSEPGGKITKLVKPSEFVFFQHVEALEGAEEFALGS